ncbi:translation initiation factor IF-5A [Pseudomonas sp. NPDC008258]|uniref:translation initiation factor IF-5A n=1 Tax=Pseudomonas sp. NPDC008258 TaxID=3364418 RepID=UPI0036EBBFC3
MSDEAFEFVSASPEGSPTYPAQAALLKKDDHVMIKNRPCKIVDISRSTNSKTGLETTHIIATDIFTGKKLEDSCPSTHNIDIPFIKRDEYSLISINEDDFLSLLHPIACETNDDVRLPDSELGRSLQKAYLDGKEISITVLNTMNENMIISFREVS